LITKCTACLPSVVVLQVLHLADVLHNAYLLTRLMRKRAFISCLLAAFLVRLQMPIAAAGAAPGRCAA
jgi:hypothetical protein